MEHRHPQHYLSLWLLVLLCAGCSQPAPVHPLPVATLRPTLALAPPPTPPSLAPTSLENSDSDWHDLDHGISLRHLRIVQGETSSKFVIVRIDPAGVRFQVGYAPNAPQGLAAWRSAQNALVVVNGGFFETDNRSSALVISGGQAAGESYQGRGGMFAIDSSGGVALRYLGEQPYDPAEPLREAIQGWPMLIKSGGRLAYTSNDGDRARRSVIALDRAGRVLIIVCTTSSMTLSELAQWLSTSDLAIDAALNLDGGSSTGLDLQIGTQQERVDAFVPLPLVLLALPT